MRYVSADIRQPRDDRYEEIENVKSVSLSKGNFEPFFDRFKEWKSRMCKDRKSSTIGVTISKEGQFLKINRNGKQPKPNQDKDFKKVMSIAKRYGFKIEEFHY